jgi:anti-sigma regulatory factor (Ser/Thr protein kinase)
MKYAVSESGDESEKEVEKLACQLNCHSKCVDFLRSMVAVMAERAGLDPCHANRVALAVDELFANIAEHGYGGEPGKIECEAHIRSPESGDGALVFNFRDYADSGWVYHSCEEDSDACDAEITPGGLGLKLINAVADRFEQEILADGNQWHLVFSLVQGERRGTEA